MTIDDPSRTLLRSYTDRRYGPWLASATRREYRRAHARTTVADVRVRIGIEPGTSGREPTAAAPAAGPAFALLEETIAARFPGVVVAPYLVLGRTDARHYEAISDNVYRFLPLRLDGDARQRLHGTDERVGVEELADAVGFYRELIRRAQRDL